MYGTFTRCPQGLLDGSLLASLSACGTGPPPRVDFLLGPYSAALTEPAAKVPTRPYSGYSQGTRPTPSTRTRRSGTGAARGVLWHGHRRGTRSTHPGT